MSDEDKKSAAPNTPSGLTCLGCGTALPAPATPQTVKCPSCGRERIVTTPFRGPESAGPDSAPPGPPKPFYHLVIKILIVVGLAIAAWLVITKMQQNAKIQDCVSQGRKNCAPIETDGR